MPEYVQQPIIISLKVIVKSDKQLDFADWQAKLNETIVAQAGFISLEFQSPMIQNQEWLIVQRFGSSIQADEWSKSSLYKQMLTELKSLIKNEKIEEDVTDAFKVKGGVTEVIIAEVNPEKETAYREWIAKIHLLEAKSPGFRGVYVQSPNESRGKFWITLLQFDTMKNLENWLASPERQKLLEESKKIISYIETHRVISPYAGWFASIAKVGELPAVWKQTMVVLLVLFPIVMMEFKYLLPLLSQLNISFSTFIGNALSVSLISFPMMPIAIYFLGWWLLPKPGQQWAESVGLLIMIALYLIEIWMFWSFV